jgi:hypothetical protein
MLPSWHAVTLGEGWLARLAFPNQRLVNKSRNGTDVIRLQILTRITTYEGA